MQSLSQKDKELTLKLNTEGLTTTQVRLIKGIHCLIANVIASEEEGEYFEMSAELMKKAAELIKSSNFPVNNKEIEYADQAVEFAIDTLNESIEKLQNFDN